MFAVEIYPPLKNKIKAPIAVLKNIVVNTAGQGRLILYRKRTKKHISTCNQYRQAQQQFYVVKDNYNKSINSFFVLWCGSLDWLDKAKPAKISYLQNYNLQLEFANLPSSLLYQAFGKRISNKAKIIEQYPDATLINIKPHTITVESKRANLKVVISLLAKADFNNDGKQQLMLSVAEYGVNGEYHQYGIHVLSKTKAAANLIEINF